MAEQDFLADVLPNDNGVSWSSIVSAQIKKAKAVARSFGIPYYLCYKSCKNGHFPSLRSTKKDACVACHHDRAKEWVSRNPSYKDKKKLLHKQWRDANIDKVRAGKRASSMRRHTAKLRRLPAWADMEAINFFYDYCPKGYQVDHIIPLQGKNISGLHVASNLQWLPSSENARKSNRYEIG